MTQRIEQIIIPTCMGCETVKVGKKRMTQEKLYSIVKDAKLSHGVHSKSCHNKVYKDCEILYKLQKGTVYQKMPQRCE